MKRAIARAASVDIDIADLFRWAHDAESRLERLERERDGFDLKDIRSFYESFIGGLRRYQRYTWKPLRELCTPRQLENLERAEKRLGDVRDKVREALQERVEIERLKARYSPEELTEIDNVIRDHEQQFADIANIGSGT